MELSHATLVSLAEVIRRLCGLALGPDKAYLVRHRLAPVVERAGLSSFDALLARLQGPGGALLHDAIIEAITTKETSFFRDRAFFQALRDTVLPECIGTVLRLKGQRHRIRVWSAGCATGQEPYSVAMLIRELIAAGDAAALGERAFTILATDLSLAALDAARAARYSAADVQRGLGAEQLAQHFVRRDAEWVLAEPVRRLVQFARFDLVQSPAALGAFDLILCRNVLIYFDEPTRQRVCAGLCAALQDGGWLALGTAESLSRPHAGLEAVKLGRVHLYRKRQRDG